MTDRECPFCQKMRVEKKKLKNAGIQARYKYAAALVTRIFLTGFREQKAMHTDYSKTDYGYKLNFCPVCGVKIGGKNDA